MSIILLNGNTLQEKLFFGSFVGMVVTLLSYNDLKEMAAERGHIVNKTTIFRWVQVYATELKKTL